MRIVLRIGEDIRVGSSMTFVPDKYATVALLIRAMESLRYLGIKATVEVEEGE